MGNVVDLYLPVDEGEHLDEDPEQLHGLDMWLPSVGVEDGAVVVILRREESC